MKKLSITICGLTLALFLWCGESAPAKSLLTSAEDDTEYDSYIIYELLESGLLNESFNLYKLRNTFLSGQLVLCVPVKYTLRCDAESECTSDFNCTSNFTSAIPFLWTLFSTESYTGKVLLYFTKNRLRSPLLGLFNHVCSFSPENSISLYLKVATFPCLKGNVSVELLITNTLIKITGVLKDYAVSNGQPTGTTEIAKGHGLSWTDDVRNQFIEETKKSEYYIPLIIIAIAFFVGVTSSFQVLKFVRKTVSEKNTSNYYWFWSSQILALVVNALYIVYTIKSASHAGQTYIIAVAVPLLAYTYAGLFIIGNLDMPLGNSTTVEGGTDTQGRRASRTYGTFQIPTREAEVEGGASFTAVANTRRADGIEGDDVETHERAEVRSTVAEDHIGHTDGEQKARSEIHERDEEISTTAVAQLQHTDGEGASGGRNTDGFSNRDPNSRSVEHEADKNARSNVAESDVLGIQVVCTDWPCCTANCCNPSQLIFRTFVVTIAAANTFVFAVYIMYTFPWVILGFYLYPVKVLVRISFIIAAALCLTLNLSVILRYLELLTSLCPCKCSRCPCQCSCRPCTCSCYCGTDENSNNQDTQNTAESGLESSTNISDQRPSQTTAKTSGTMNPKKSKKLQHLVWKQLFERCASRWASTAARKRCCSDKTIRCSSKMIRAMFKFITSIVVLAALICVGILFYHIIFIFSSDVETTIEEVLTILPTVAISLSVYFLRGRLSYEGELKSILSVLTPHQRIRRRLNSRRRTSRVYHPLRTTDYDDDDWEELLPPASDV